LAAACCRHQARSVPPAPASAFTPSTRCRERTGVHANHAARSPAFLAEDRSREHVERLRGDRLLTLVGSKRPLGPVLMDVPTNAHNPRVNGGQIRAGLRDTRA
jgi:hypothetical protein